MFCVNYFFRKYFRGSLLYKIGYHICSRNKCNTIGYNIITCSGGIDKNKVEGNERDYCEKKTNDKSDYRMNLDLSSVIR